MQRVNTYHIPVLLSESVAGLGLRRGGVYVDVTFGGGGHSREILRQLAALGGGHLFAFDQDADAQRNAFGDSFKDNSDDRDNNIGNKPLPPGVEFTFVHSNFRYLRNWMRYYDVEQLDGVLADLGVSSHHFDTAERGFSFRADAPLDMRMNRSGGATAADIVNTYSEERLAGVLYYFGELRASRRLAAALVAARKQAPILTTAALLAAVERLLHPGDAARLFQALRIEVNHELAALQEMLAAATDLLAPGGRLSVITYHSLEDRMVKHAIRGDGQRDEYGRSTATLRAVNRSVITPDNEEQERNPRSRSAKLRIAEKVVV